MMGSHNYYANSEKNSSEMPCFYKVLEQAKPIFNDSK